MQLGNHRNDAACDSTVRLVFIMMCKTDNKDSITSGML